MSIRATKQDSGAGTKVNRGGEPPEARILPVVGVGASAGGLKAIIAFLEGLADDTGMAFVLVQQVDGSREVATGDILSKATRMPVVAAGGKLAVKANHVYAVPPNCNVTIRGGVLRLGDRQDVGSRNFPIDRLLDSLAEDRTSAAIGIVLSGAAPDGARGLQAIKAGGGLTF